MEAAVNGSREIGFTVISMTLSLVAVFIPVLFLGGLIGRLFQEFAVTIGVAILVSGFVSLTLTPMLCSRWLKPEREQGQHGRFYQAIERAWEGSLAWYERTLAWVMDRRGLAMLFALLILVGTIVLGRIVPKGFIPSEDTGQLNGTTETAEGTSYDAMVTHQRAAAAIVQEDPNVEGFMSSVGAGGRSASVNQGRLFIHLKPRDQRAMSADEVAQSLTRKLAVVPGMRVYITNPPVINIGGRQSKSLYQFTLQGSDIGDLYDGAAALERRLHDIPGLTDVTSDLQIKNPQVKVSIARDRAAALGIDVDQIENALYNAYGARQVSTIYTSNDQYWVVMELLPAVPAGPLGDEPAAHHRPRRGVGPARQPGAGDAVDGAAHGEPLGPAAVGDAVVQPRARRVDRHRGGSRAGGRPRGAAVHHQHRASRARPRRSSRRSRGCWCCSCSRSW